MSKESGTRRTIMPVVLRAAFAVAAMWLLFTLVDPEAVLSAIQRSDPVWLLGAVLLVPLHLGLRAFRWHLLIRTAGIQFPLGYTVRVVLAGYAFSAVTPGEVGDFFVRSRFHGGTERGTIPALVLVDKIVQMVAITGAGIPAVAFILLESWIIAFGILCVFFLIIAAVAQKRRWLLDRPVIRSWADRFKVTAGLQALSDIPRYTVVILALLSGGMVAVYALQEVCLLNAVGTVSFGTALLGYLSAMLAVHVLPFSLAGLGIREGGHVYFFGLLGVPAVVALSASLLLFTVNVLLPSMLGLIVFLLLRKQSSDQQ